MSFRPRTTGTTRRLAVSSMAICAAMAAVRVPAARAQQLPGGVSLEQLQRMDASGIRDLLDQAQAAGMTTDQIRQRLASMGYDPTVLDSYLDRSTPATGLPQPTSDVLTALRALGVEPTGETGADTLGLDTLGLDTLMNRRARRESMLPDSSAFEKEMGLRVFGLDVFARRTTEFRPLTTGPVPDTYVLGPGDQLVLFITGDLEDAYTLPVTRDGFIVIPQVGQVWVNGLTLAQLRDRLYSVLGRVYSGIRRGPDATTHFDVTLGRLRSNQLFVTGEVVQPGTYLVSPVASVLNALYAARGPTPDGSFRDIRLMRGDRIVQHIDLYDYLVRGNNLSSLVLQPGDVVYVPVRGDLVAIRGEVTRPGLYELKPGETLRDLVAFAGGLSIPARVNRARITRIVPPEERDEAGVDRVVLDVDLGAALSGAETALTLRAGDDVRVFRLRSEVRRMVSITGAVWNECGGQDEGPRMQNMTPFSYLDTGRKKEQATTDTVLLQVTRDSLTGRLRRESQRRMPTVRADSDSVKTRTVVPCAFAFQPGMRAWDLIDRAGGLRPDAYRAGAHIVRLNPADSTLSMIPFSLRTTPGGEPVDNPELREFDVVEVMARSAFHDSLTVSISGEVRDPGSRRYAEGMTLGNLILLAGGLTPEADLTVEIARRPNERDRPETRLADLMRVHVDSSFIVSETGIRLYPGNPFGADVRSDPDAGPNLVLEPFDRVFVRRVPSYEAQRTVKIQGEVRYPGQYALGSKDERLSSLIQRAGGPTTTAYIPGFRLYRDGNLVNVDLPAVLEHPGGRDDPALLAGDSMVLPEYNPVVLVRGAVNAPAAILYKEGASLEYYIRNAGGYAEGAARDRVHIRYANGSGDVRRQVLFFTLSPTPGPGSVVTVPYEPEKPQINLGLMAQIAGSLATLIIALTR